MADRSTDVIDPDRYGSGGERKPPLTPDLLDGSDVAILTIENVRHNIQTGDGRLAALLEFAEVPEYVFWLNKTGIRALVEKLGDRPSAWAGRKVPLVQVRVNNPTTGKMVTKYQVADPDDWDLFLNGKKQRSRKEK